jgi:hypothetical protein
MRAIFLDIDGVLNNQESAGRRWSVRLPQAFDHSKTSAVPPFHSACVARLNALIARTDAKVVISSTWGRLFRLNDLTRYLADQGVVAQILGATPVKLAYRPRGEDIQHWLDDWPGEPVEAFCILDDHDDMGNLLGRLVQTDPTVGLQDDDVRKAFRLLTLSA